MGAEDRLLRIATVSLSMLASSCAGPREVASVAGRSVGIETISYEVGPCFGFCPVYHAAIASDGNVSFEGIRHTATLGAKSLKVDRGAYATFANALASYRPASGTNVTTTCETRISDQQHYRIIWTAPDGTTSMLEHDRGCRSPRNDELNALLLSAPERLGIAGLARQLTRPGASRG